MIEKALFLVEPTESSEADKVARTLHFLGVSANRLTVAEFLSSGETDAADNKFRLLCTGSTFLKLLTRLEAKAERPFFWERHIHSAFVYAGGDFSSFESVTAKVMGEAAVLAHSKPAAEWTVTDDLPEFCKSMSGIRVSVKGNAPEKSLVFEETKANAIRLISNGSQAAFVRFVHQTVPIFLSTAASIIDIGVKLSGNDFDIREYFFTATPLILFVKWAFAQTCYQAPETPACLVIDDPLLKPRYGFLKYRRLLDLMRQHNFSTSIAFIPWNWRRSSTRIVRLFKENPRNLSLSIHGCDHTGGEFGTSNVDRLAWKSKKSLQRMGRHQSRTGLSYDRVMVFPQGVFSAQAMDVLKRNHFIGVVNSEVFSTDREPPAITIEDYWNVAVMNYGDFPIFTRRYPRAGVENFAFDILLGKPCLVVVHHNDCHDECRHIVEFMDRLNQLNVPLRWTGLADVVSRSFRQREISPEVVGIEMYGSEVRIENNSSLKKIYRFRKPESVAEHINAVCDGTKQIKWVFKAEDRSLIFEVALNPGETKTVSITFQEFAVGEGFAGESLLYQLKAMARRYLSEMRDNYVTRKSFSA